MANNAVITWDIISNLQNDVNANADDIRNMDMRHRYWGSKDYGYKTYNIKDVKFSSHRKYFNWKADTNYFLIPKDNIELPSTANFVALTGLEIDNFINTDNSYIQYSVILDRKAIVAGAENIGVVVRSEKLKKDINFFIDIMFIEYAAGQ